MINIRIAILTRTMTFMPAQGNPFSQTIERFDKKSKIPLLNVLPLLFLAEIIGGQDDVFLFKGIVKCS